MPRRHQIEDARNGSQSAARYRRPPFAETGDRRRWPGGRDLTRVGSKPLPSSVPRASAATVDRSVEPRDQQRYRRHPASLHVVDWRVDDIGWPGMTSGLAKESRSCANHAVIRVVPILEGGESLSEEGQRSAAPRECCSASGSAKLRHETHHESQRADRATEAILRWLQPRGQERVRALRTARSQQADGDQQQKKMVLPPPSQLRRMPRMLVKKPQSTV
jgi:hypothetical protein